MFGTMRATAQANQTRTAPAPAATRRIGVGNQAQLRRLAHSGPAPSATAEADVSGSGLVIGAENDPLEFEADRIADQVMTAAPPPDPRAADPGSPGRAPPKVSRKCSACEDEDQKSRSLQAAPAAPGSVDAGATAPASVDRVLASPGRSLDDGERAFFEPRFGQDFGHVRLHADAAAGASARAVGALAYAVGDHVVVDPGRYRAGSDDGRRLMAHELTHTLQQRGAGSLAALRRAGDGGPDPAPDTGPDAQPAQGAQDADPAAEGDQDDDDDVEDGDVDLDGLDGTPDIDLSSIGLGGDAPEAPQPMSAANQPANAAGAASASPEAGPAGGDQDPDPARRDPGKAPAGKIVHIDVDQTSQRMTLTWSNGVKEGDLVVSTGRGDCGTTEDPCKSQNSRHCTPNLDNVLINSRGDPKTKNPKGDKMYWFVGIAAPGRRGIGIHNSQIADGTPRSHGCVRTGSEGGSGEALAKKINQKILVKKTTITITGKAKTKPYPCPKKKGKKP